MNKILLQNKSHIFQMLGSLDGEHGYVLPKNIADILLRIPKVPVVSKDEIDVGANVNFLESAFEIEGEKIQFCLENSTLFLLERASEMGGLVAYTYLIPLAELTLDYFKTLDTAVDLSLLKERKQQRRAQYSMMLSEHERLAKTALRRVQKTLGSEPLPEFQELMSASKRFIRLGKPDFNISSLQLLEAIINKKNLKHPAAEIIKRWKTLCGNKTSALLLADIAVQPHKFQTSNTNNPSGKGKALDFKSLLAAMMNQDKPKQPRTRIKPSKKAAEIINAEHEVEFDFEPEEKMNAETNQSQQITQEEIDLQQLVSQLLEKQDVKPVKATQKSSLQDKKQASRPQPVPASLNHDREQ